MTMIFQLLYLDIYVYSYNELDLLSYITELRDCYPTTLENNLHEAYK